MKTAFYIILAIGFFVYIGKTSISFSPFKVSMDKPAEALGFLFLVLALGCMRYQAWSDGKDTAIKTVIENFTLTKKNK